MLFRSNDTATTEIYTVGNTLSLHDALPICYENDDHFSAEPRKYLLCSQHTRSAEGGNDQQRHQINAEAFAQEQRHRDDQDDQRGDQLRIHCRWDLFESRSLPTTGAKHNSLPSVDFWGAFAHCPRGTVGFGVAALL